MLIISNLWSAKVVIKEYSNFERWLNYWECNRNNKEEEAKNNSSTVIVRLA